jgi:enediyne biosynthesis protein E4
MQPLREQGARFSIRLSESFLPILMRYLVGLSTCVLLTAFGCNKADPENTVTDLQKNSDAKSSDARGTASPIQLLDVSSTVGLDFVYRNGEDQNQSTILESLGGGVGVIDFDLDGWPDLFFPGGGTFADSTVVGVASELFRNQAGVRFVRLGTLAGNGFTSEHYTHGAFVADYNNDGFPDVLVSGYGGLQLWENHGDGTFEDVHQTALLLDDKWSSGAGWGDFNNDGSLDLYVAHYVNWSFANHPNCPGPVHGQRDICPPRSFEGIPDMLYLGQGDGTFLDVSQEWQLRTDGSKGLGVLIADLDENGFVDAYVANDTTNNYLYSNTGAAPFQEVASLAGVAADKAGIPNGSMGLDVCDFNQNGRPDIWVTNYEREDFALYRNEGPNAFLHVSDITGLNVLGGLFVGFGTVCSDLDLDTLEDIVVNNGHVILYPTASPRKQRPVVMLSKGRRFERVVFSDDSYLHQSHDGRGLVTVDFDNDGDLDLVFSNMNSSAALIRNDTLSNSPKNAGRTDSKHHWLQVGLVGTEANRSAIGAVVSVEVDGKALYRFKKGGGSYMSTSQDEQSFGLGAASTISNLTVKWPSGKITTLTNVAANQKLLVVEPSDE